MFSYSSADVVAVVGSVSVF